MILRIHQATKQKTVKPTKNINTTEIITIVHLKIKDKILIIILIANIKITSIKRKMINSMICFLDDLIIY